LGDNINRVKPIAIGLTSTLKRQRLIVVTGRKNSRPDRPIARPFA
jgi:hypothetical protein